MWSKERLFRSDFLSVDANGCKGPLGLCFVSYFSELAKSGESDGTRACPS